MDQAIDRRARLVRMLGALDSLRAMLVEELREHGSSAAAQKGWPLTMAELMATRQYMCDPETKRERIRQNVRYRLEHGDELAGLPILGLTDHTSYPSDELADLVADLAGKPL